MALTTTDQAPAIQAKPPATPLTGCEAVKAEIAKYSDWDSNIVQAIAKAENQSCNPKTHNLTSTETHRDAYTGKVICVGSYGALQVGCLHYRPGQDRNDLKTNVEVAHGVWQREGYTAWTKFKNGEYKRFL